MKNVPLLLIPVFLFVNNSVRGMHKQKQINLGNEVSTLEKIAVLQYEILEKLVTQRDELMKQREEDRAIIATLQERMIVLEKEKPKSLNESKSPKTSHNKKQISYAYRKKKKGRRR